MKHIFNIVCVTKKFLWKETTQQYLDIQGEATVDTATGKCFFKGKESPLIYSRYGLCSSCIVLGIKFDEVRFYIVDPSDIVVAVAPEMHENDVWELYTDTPHLNSNSTPEDIREIANLAIKSRKRSAFSI